MTSHDSEADRDTIERLVEVFVEAYRRGERPSPDEFAARYPERADEIRQLLPALVMMEQYKPGRAVEAPPPRGPMGLDAIAGQPTEPEVVDGLASTIGAEPSMGPVADPEATTEQAPHLAEATLTGSASALPPPAPLAWAARADDPEATTERPTDGEPASAPWPTIPDYEILGVLGRGGMGIVYKARHRPLERIVALKVIRADKHASAEERARFEQEARLVANLAHENIVKIHDFGEARGLRYFSMEYVVGGSLAQKVDGQPQDPPRSASLVEMVARAMHAAHESGVIHRDLKPLNVLLTADGVPKVSDFGLAKRLESDSSYSHTGDIMGTPTYMSPEQASGRSCEAGRRSDVYSMGAVLYTLLTGRPPLQGPSPMETLELVRTKEPVAPSQLQPKVPRDLETICLKCLRKEPERRYETAEHLADDLRRFLNGETILARPASIYERAWRWARRNPKVAVLSAAVAALLCAVTAISAIYTAVLIRKDHELRKSVAAAFEQNRAALEAWRSLGRVAMLDLKELPGAQPLRQKILDEVNSGLRNTIAGMEPLYPIYRQSKNAREADFAMAGVYKLLGDDLLEMNRVREALEQYQHMARIVEAAAAADPNDIDIQYQLANNRAVLGSVSLNYLGDAKAAAGYFKEALALRQKRLALEPESDAAKLAVANALGQLATCDLRLGDPMAAKGLFQREVEVRESLGGTAGRSYEARRELGALCRRLGELSLQLNDVTGARKNHERSLGICEALAAEDPHHFPNRLDLNLYLTNLGSVNLLSLNDPQAARAYFQRASTGSASSTGSGHRRPSRSTSPSAAITSRPLGCGCVITPGPRSSTANASTSAGGWPRRPRTRSARST